MKTDSIFSETALAGKGVVIVGGTRGLGLAATRACARADVRVVAVGRDATRAADILRELDSAVRVVTLGRPCP